MPEHHPPIKKPQKRIKFKKKKTKNQKNKQIKNPQQSNDLKYVTIVWKVVYGSRPASTIFKEIRNKIMWQEFSALRFGGNKWMYTLWMECTCTIKILCVHFKVLIDSVLYDLSFPFLMVTAGEYQSVLY